MSKTLVKPRTKVRLKTQRPPLYKVILLNDDYTPREFVVLVLKAVFRMNEDQAYRVMMTAHQKGACVIAVYARDVAETKAKEATELGKQKRLSAVFHHRARRMTMISILYGQMLCRKSCDKFASIFNASKPFTDIRRDTSATYE